MGLEYLGQVIKVRFELNWNKCLISGDKLTKYAFLSGDSIFRKECILNE